MMIGTQLKRVMDAANVKDRQLGLMLGLKPESAGPYIWQVSTNRKGVSAERADEIGGKFGLPNGALAYPELWDELWWRSTLNKLRRHAQERANAEAAA